MTERAEFLSRYKHLRQVAFELNNRLVPTLSKDVLDEGGKKLGILKKNVLVLDSEDEIAVLMDYCIYDVRRNGGNAIERYLAHSPPAPDSEEMVILQAMRQARFSLFVVETTEPGVGVQVRDLLRDEALFVTDVGFSQTASPGLVIAMRVMAPEGISMTTGAALPFGMLPPAARAGLLHDLTTTFPGTDFQNLSPERASTLAATILRACLEQGAAEHIHYLDPEDVGGSGGRGGQGGGEVAPPPVRPVGRNSPCPCGSGKKFKHCCGSRR